MSLTPITLAQGQAALRELLSAVPPNHADWNEADTRFQLINRLIVDCLGWPTEVVKCEKHQDREYSDYELGKPRKAIWEAKRYGRLFELPANAAKKLMADLPSLMALGGELSEAIRQVQGYCVNRGVDVAVATNGHQFVAFLATRNDGVSPLSGNCFVINGLKQLEDEFPTVWQLLSPDGVFERRLYRRLNVGEDKPLPRKIAFDIPSYNRPRYTSSVQRSLQTIAELLLVDVVADETVERRFYEECYCQSGALSQYSTISKNILADRYAAMFDGDSKQPIVESILGLPEKGKRKIAPTVLSEAIAKRPIILLGDVGVGKTSFLKNLMLREATDEFKDAIFIHIDLGTTGALNADLRQFILDQINEQLLKKYSIDIFEDSFVRGVYNLDIKRFEKGIYGSQKAKNRNLYENKLLENLEKKTNDLANHLQASLAHIAKARRKQIVVFLDNADQRAYEIQQEAFIIAENLAKEWNAAVFFAIRPSTFFKSKQSGALAAYQNRVFTIDPPRVDEVVTKRLEFALNIASGQIDVERLHHIRLDLGSVALFLKALIQSLKGNAGIVEFLDNIAGGNIRVVMDLIAKFIGTPNVDSNKYISEVGRQGWHFIPTHEFWKSALLGDNRYYDPDSSIAMNVFDVVLPEPQNHFVVPLVLSYLNWDNLHRSSEGFVPTESIVEEMQNLGFAIGAVESALRRANNKKLIEAPKRLTFAEDEAGLHGEFAKHYRITTVGGYHVDRWLAEFSYLDAMCVDTPIFDDGIRKKIAERIESFEIVDRFERASLFRSYLSSVWGSSNIKRQYFDWASKVGFADKSFQLVKRAIDRNGQPRFGGRRGGVRPRR
jgi:GTPase SAR1 family protein